MKQIGGVTYIGLSLKDLNKYFKEDAVIHISKKFLKSYLMISGVEETIRDETTNEHAQRDLIGIKRDLDKLTCCSKNSRANTVSGIKRDLDKQVGTLLQCVEAQPETRN